MDLTKEALEFIQQSAGPNIINHMGDSYSDKALHKLPNYNYPCCLEVSTLSAVADYMNSEMDDDLVSMFLVIIDSPSRVRLLSEVDDDMKRMHLMTATACLPDIKFDRFVDRESFNIQLQSCFVGATEDDILTDNIGDKELLLNIISSIQTGSIAEYTDDGISQTANLKHGAKLQTALIPNPVTLAPYRSFPEIDQVESEFVFRLKEDEGTILCGLFPADGGAWKLEARKRVKAWFEQALDEEVLQNTVILA
ncbi:MAG: hypothetical protein Q4E09_06065 [Eubacteriales bacterium]|nr:hypothetical protein [Eubacteriales bacterium]